MKDKLKEIKDAGKILLKRVNEKTITASHYKYLYKNTKNHLDRLIELSEPLNGFDDSEILTGIRSYIKSVIKETK